MMAKRKVLVVFEYFSKRLLASNITHCIFCVFCYKRHIELSRYYIGVITGKKKSIIWSLSVAL